MQDRIHTGQNSITFRYSFTFGIWNFTIRNFVKSVNKAWKTFCPKNRPLLSPNRARVSADSPDPPLAPLLISLFQVLLFLLSPSSLIFFHMYVFHSYYS